MTHSSGSLVEMAPRDEMLSLAVAPAQVLRGSGALAKAAAAIASLGKRPIVVGGKLSLALVSPILKTALDALTLAETTHGADCCESGLEQMRQAIVAHQADVVIGVGGGKALDAAKLVAHQCNLPVVTVPTSAATCAAWTALSNVYSEQGAFRYDVALPHCPELVVLDYDLVQTAPQRTLIAGIGDALAKWYEASVSSGHSERTLLISAVQQARVLRDLMLQKAVAALQNPGSDIWRDVVDASVLLAGVIGGVGGAQCRTVAAHAVHNGLTQLTQSHDILHGEKVAYGILVQLRLEEMLQGSGLAATARQQLLKFYGEIGLPTTLGEMGLASITLTELECAAEFACQTGSDIHRLPFAVTPDQLMAAMVSTTAPGMESRSSMLNPQKEVEA